MARHREFESATESIAVNRHHNRLTTIFNAGQKRMKSFASRLLPGCNFAELLDVGAGDKGPSRASQDSGLDLGVAFNRFHRCQNAFQDAGLSMTSALGTSPHCGSGTGMTAASYTSACTARTFSTSREEIFSPPLTIMSFLRSTIKT